MGIINIYEVLSKYSLAIHPSKVETGPLMLIEYLNAQPPFIAHKTGDVGEEICDDLPIFIASNLDMNTWIDKIGEILNMDNKEFYSIQKK